MAGDARGLLEQMRVRLERGPHAALGIPDSAAAPAARAAFLQLTKTYHPAKFAREAPEVVRQANEIFLALRAAYDQITGGKRSTQALPITPALARGPGVGRSTGQVSPPPAGHAAPYAPAPSPAPTPSPAAAPSTAPSPSPIVTLKPGSPAPSTPTAPSGNAVGSSAARPAPRPAATPLRPVRPAAPSPAPAPSPPSVATPPRAAAPVPARQTGAIPKLSDGVIAGSEEADLEIAMHYIKRKQWTEARKQLHALAARVPVDKRYRALLAYARGREQQDEGRHDEARAEFQRALQLDPDLYMAKNALQQLGVLASSAEEPAKPSGGGGLFSRLFKK